MIKLLAYSVLALPGFAAVQACDNPAESPSTLVSAAAQQQKPQTQKEPPKLDVPYVPTPQAVVDEMLRLAKVKKDEMVYDLGCGDGRIVITAAKQFGARGIGVDIDPERISDSNRNAQIAGVTDRVKFLQQDLFKMDFKDADVLALYLFSSINMKLRPRILDELRPGTRVVSHAFDMGDWEPDATAKPDGRQVFLWIVPAKVAGTWTWTDGGQERSLVLEQKFQKVSGSLKGAGTHANLTDAKLDGDKLTFTTKDPAGRVTAYEARIVRPGVLEGTVKVGEQSTAWNANMKG